MDVHLVDGTYELFRQFFGRKGRSQPAPDGTEVGAAAGVVSSLLTMIEEGATHLAVATDHPIESFRNDLWPGYKSSAGLDPVILSQIPVLEEAVRALGITVLVMDDLEADDGLASVAAVAADDSSVRRVLIWSPDKDLAQCVRGERVVQVDRRNGAVLGEAAVIEKFGVPPLSIPDWLALVGDSADGFPGIAGWGKQSASAVLAVYGHLEQIPSTADGFDPALAKRVRSCATLAARLAEEMELALLFRDLATLRVDRDLVTSVTSLEWRGPESGFEQSAAYLGSSRLLKRSRSLAARAK